MKICFFKFILYISIWFVESLIIFLKVFVYIIEIDFDLYEFYVIGNVFDFLNILYILVNSFFGNEVVFWEFSLFG